MMTRHISPKILLAHILHLLHLALCLWIIGGWLIPYPPASVAHIIICLAAPLHWILGEGRCFLTSWVLKLKSSPHSTPEHVPLTKQIFQTLHRRAGCPMLQDQQLKLLAFTLPLVSATISALRWGLKI